MGLRTIFGAVVLIALFACPAAAQQALPFDPEAATRAWIATMGPEAIARSNRYFEGGYWIQFVSAAIALATCALLLTLGWARAARDWLERTVKARFLVALGVAAAFTLVSSAISFPFDYWVGFVREHEFGLSTQSFGAWFGEFATAFAINLVISSLVIAILYTVVRFARTTWWVWGAGVAILLFAVGAVLSPVYIAPLFNTYTPMAEGPLRSDILHLTQANGVPADNVYVFDASRQSHRVTANVSGFLNTTRISLADNLLKRASPDAVRFVTGHETGHYVLGHIGSLLVMFTLLISILFALVNWGFRALSTDQRWGIRGIDDPAGLPLAIAVFTALSLIATPINNNITRFHERQADLFGLNASRAPDGMAEAALLLSEYRKMEPTGLEEWFFYDHPSGWDRIHTAMVWKANEMAGGRYPAGPGGPPPGWRPDFVVMASSPSQAPAAPDPASAPPAP
jgi:STE24 endopeptidase